MAESASKIIAAAVGGAALGYFLSRPTTKHSDADQKPKRTLNVMPTSSLSRSETELSWVSGKVNTGLKEFSVIYTDRAINLLSEPFKKVMRHISSTMRKVYNAHSFALIPGSGTYGMEAVARQFGTGKRVLILRNGYFSFRWTDIINVGKFTDGEPVVIKAAPVPGEERKFRPQFAPLPVAHVAAEIRKHRPAVVFAPHVETSTGMILSTSYISGVAQAAHEVGALFVLDCVASGNIWIDMKATGVDVLITAPQKGWSGPACCALVLLSERARNVAMDPAAQPVSNSFSCNLNKWITVMDKYDEGGCMYYTTLPTDALTAFSSVITETEKIGFDFCESQMRKLGAGIREVLEENGFTSVAAEDFKSPSVIVSYSPYEGMGGKFANEGLQIAGGVPFKLGEDSLEHPVDARKMCFRLGMFGIDKLMDVEGTIRIFKSALSAIIAKETSGKL